MAEINKISTNINLLFNIRSKIIMKIILDNLTQKTKLNIIRYNKKIQNRFNIGIDDYIKENSLIIIEIIPLENKYGNFINIFNSKLQPNYRIYFDDNNNEVKRTFIFKMKKLQK